MLFVSECLRTKNVREYKQDKNQIVPHTQMYVCEYKPMYVSTKNVVREYKLVTGYQTI